MTFQYPSRDLDRSAKLITFLGSHWAGTYEGTQEAEDFTYSRAQLEAQTEQQRDDAQAAVSRFEVPVNQTDIWFNLVLQESEMNGEAVDLNRYGAGFVYGNQPGTGEQYQYGIPHGIGLYSFVLPEGLRVAPLICNRITEPSVTLVEGLDYYLDTEAGVLHFRENPFDNELIATRDIFTGADLTDREVSLWLFRGQFDLDYIFQHFGYVLGIDLPGTLSYKNLINAIWDGMVEGGDYDSVNGAVAAIADAPVVLEASETVEAIFTDSTHLVVATDQHVYRYNSSASVSVAVGDTVRAGDQLSNAYVIHEFQRGTVDSALTALTLDRNYLIEGYLGGLTFRNADVPLVVDTSGVFTKISFELGGWPGDVVQFFDDLHARGISEGETLAHLLDQRDNAVGEPGASNLPATINPLVFLAENVLRNNVFAIQWRPTSFGPNALGIDRARELRGIIPPHTGMIFTVELAMDRDVVTMEEAGDETAPGYEESLASYQAGEPEGDSLPPATFVVESEPVAKHIEGLCP